MLKTVVMAVTTVVVIVIGTEPSSAAEPAATSSPSAPAADFDWPAPTQTARPWTRWWWLGSAVDEPNVTRCLEQYHAAGIGGVEITCIYGVKGAEHRNLAYLSDPWLSVVTHTAREAHRLAMGVDLPTGSGWRIGGPSVAAADGNAEVTLQNESVDPADAYERTYPNPLPQAVVAYSSTGEIVELTDRIDAQGHLTWKAPAQGQPWTIHTVGMKLLGEKVERAAPGGEGFDVNAFSRRGLDAFLATFRARIDLLPSGSIRAAFHDSFEYEGDWCDDFLDEFRERRGYSLEHHLPALTGQGAADEIARVKSDYRQTIADLVQDDLIHPWVDWCHDRNQLARLQAHGSPGNWLDLYASCDIPETESFGRLDVGDAHPMLFKFATSAAHVVGRPLVSSESATWLDEHFTVTLDQVKRIIDRQFLAGVNHTIYHGTTYSPSDVPWPGWLFYASSELNPQNPIWRDFSELNRYVTRCQSLLQDGQPDNDVLLYWPFNDVIHHADGLRPELTVHSAAKWCHGTPFGNVAQLLDAKGYAFDYVSDRQLSACETQDGGIVTAGSTYGAVVVPQTGLMPASTLATLHNLAAGGATVIFLNELPGGPPGLARPKETQTFAEAREKINQALKKTGSGVLLGDDLETLLQHATVRCEQPLRAAGLQFLRRKLGDGRCYFLSNERNEPFDGYVQLTADLTGAILMDPLSGRVGTAEIGDGRKVRLQLKPGQSVFIRTTNSKTSAKSWAYDHPEGVPMSIEGPWSIEFISGGPQLPAAIITGELQSWTKFADPELARFAGTAAYAIAFDLDSLASAAVSTTTRPADSRDAYLLDLGRVGDSARVILNGQEVATLFTSPFQTRIDALAPGKNELRIEVTNVPANRIRDLDRRAVPWRIFEDINFVDINYKPFDASQWPVRDAGLLGPVTLQPLPRNER